MCRYLERATRCKGFTLLEMIVVIVLMGIVATMIGGFLRVPIDMYVLSSRRAEMTDVADLTLRRIAQDIRAAVPNSVWVSGDGLKMELILAGGGGRYRAYCPTAGTSICPGFAVFTAGSSGGFDIIGGINGTQSLSGSVSMVINNQPPTNPFGYSDVYAGTNVRSVTVSATQVSGITTGFPTGSDFHRFQIIAGRVMYICDSAQSRLLRYSNYVSDYTKVQPDIMATDVNCTGSYFGVPGRASGAGEIIGMRLQIQHPQSGESIALYHEVNVINGP